MIKNSEATAHSPTGQAILENVARPSQSPVIPLSKTSRDELNKLATINVPAAAKALSPRPVSKSFEVEPRPPTITSKMEMKLAPTKAAAEIAQVFSQIQEPPPAMMMAIPRSAPPKTPVNPGSASGLRNNPC